ncbi:RNA-guided endonuclease IscB [Caballeronia sp. LZ025]|uniref:RNA-guided endonuclease IscB n=1 Tax=Caballeronia sp. LZ025 TaxID=3038562 RepID=UPI00285C0534|nr:RNA-guided endonuclease IscB [Caballeronia sp. LZ025]MDR5732666.1 RNA-guided endonuclease IscB [Caballeronia sp. LZ025]
MAVFVLDRYGRPLMPCSEKRARLLLVRGRARVHRVMPFVIRLTDRERASCEFEPLRLKLDPGSKATGLALVVDRETLDTATGELRRGAAVLNLFELVHRGRQISDALRARSAMRRSRRGKLRYRAPRFLNRTRTPGSLPPSLQHRVNTTMAWVRRVRRWAPIAALSCELVRFDMQLLDNPEVTGAGYQRGTLAGYEFREYLLEKWGRRCAYCDAKSTPLQLDHIVARSRGGSNRASNLTLACEPCNRAKGALPVDEFLAKRPKRLAGILAQSKRSLKDAAAVNATRWALTSALKATGMSLELGSGGRTKFNRSVLGVPKTHALDAACVGALSFLTGWKRPTLFISCTGRGSYQRTRLDRYGFPRGYMTRTKRVHGFQTGDLVRADVPAGRKAGTHIGRAAVRVTGSFNIQKSDSVVQGVAHRYCRLIQRSDGYGYTTKPFFEGDNARRPCRTQPWVPSQSGQ